MERFVKLPIEVEAWQVGSGEPVPQWLSDAMMRGQVCAVDDRTDELDILTLEGVMRAFAGSWIIRGAKGELYPCRVDIFAQTYRPAPGAGGSDAEIVCEELRAAIVRTGWSETARRSGVDRCNLHRAFTAERRGGGLPSFATVAAVARALGLRLCVFERSAHG